jgi:hypothetical protein
MRRRVMLFVVIPSIIFVLGAMIFRVSIYLTSPERLSAGEQLTSVPVAVVKRTSPPELVTPLQPIDAGTAVASDKSAAPDASVQVAKPQADAGAGADDDDGIDQTLHQKIAAIEPDEQPARRERRLRSRRKPVQETLPEELPSASAKLPALAPVLLEPDEAVRIAIRDAKPLLARCYEMELKKRALFNGFLVVNISVTAAGRITQATVDETTAKEAQVAACIAAKLKRLKLPHLTADAEVSVPIKLEARGL